MTTTTVEMNPGDSTETIRLRIELAKLQAELETLRTKGKPTSPGMKVSPKGALSVYGLGRFPVTLYKAQWYRLLEMTDRIREFIKLNDASLTEKSDESAEEKAVREAHNAEQIQVAQRQRAVGR